IAARCGVAVTAVTTDAGHLNGALIDIGIVRLISVAAGIGSRHRDADRVIQHERCVNEASMRETVAAIAGLVTPARNQTRLATIKSQSGYVSADRCIAVAAITTHACNLCSTLISLDRAPLNGLGRGIEATDRNVDRRINCDRSVYQRSEEVALATVTSTVVAGVDQGVWRSVHGRQCWRPRPVMAAMQVYSIRQMPKIHARFPRHNRPAPTGGTLPRSRKKRCHTGEPKAESPIRVTTFQALDMRSGTPVGR